MQDIWSEQWVCVYEMQPADSKVRVVHWDNSEITTKSHQRSGWKPCHEIFHFSQSTPKWVCAHGLTDWGCCQSTWDFDHNKPWIYGYLSAVTYNITEHNHCITWNCALAVILVKCIVGNSQALLFHLVKMALEFLRTVHSEWIFKIQTNKTNIKRKNCMLFNGKNMLKVHVCYDSRPDSSSSSSYSHYHCCFIFISTVPSSGLLVYLVVVNSGQRYKSPSPFYSVVIKIKCKYLDLHQILVKMYKNSLIHTRITQIMF